jgi:hypothetical protein
MIRHPLRFLPAILLLAVGAAHAQTNVRIRGTITAVDATTLSVKSREGRDLTLLLPDSATVAVARAVAFADLKDGDYIGTTTKAGPDGIEVAIEVHYLAPTVAPGQGPWDLVPNSRMTNARVQGKVAGAAQHELTLQVGSGTQKIVVPDGTPIVRTVPGTRADLKTGEYVFVSGPASSDGALTALRIQVSKDGVRPPQ